MLDAACAEAVELARAAAREAGGADVGEHVDVVAEADRVASHSFACARRGYGGWRWTVTVARASRAKVVTVDEVALLPGPDALLPPAWVPWVERVQAGDLGVGGLVPTDSEDPGLVPAYAGLDLAGPQGAWSAEPGLLDELWFGRARVLSVEGRDEAADRWRAGGGGPDAPIAKKAPARCGSCAWSVPLAGALGQVFAVCSNLLAPDDGRVVSFDHGCGGHSEAEVSTAVAPLTDPVDDGGDDAFDLGDEVDGPPEVDQADRTDPVDQDDPEGATTS